jgi:glucose-1-phosphate thymidylyltransferase
MKRKGIILAGGHGTRLYPMTSVTSKHLLPIYNKPMIYYSLTTLMLSGIQDFLIIALPRDIENYQTLLGDGSKWGLHFEYAAQKEPKGLADAFLIGRDFIGKDSVALILGDNIFYGDSLSYKLQTVNQCEKDATIFAYSVKDPRAYGVVSIEEGKATSLEEKPANPKSNYAVPGLYFYDNDVISMAEALRPSSRGELEITDLNREYMKLNRLNVEILRRGVAWFDGGSPSALLQTSNFIETVEERQGILIGSPEEIAFREGYINAEQLEKLAKPLIKSSYGQYLMDLAKEVAHESHA